jgi:hypothetical protein
MQYPKFTKASSRILTGRSLRCIFAVRLDILWCVCSSVCLHHQAQLKFFKRKARQETGRVRDFPCSDVTFRNISLRTTYTA